MPKLEVARRLNPLDVTITTDLAAAHAWFGEFQRAEDLLLQAAELAPSFHVVSRVAALVAVQQGDAELAWERIMAPVDQIGLGLLLQRAEIARLTRDPGKLETVLREWPEEFRTPDFVPFAFDLWSAELFIMQGDFIAGEALYEEIWRRLEPNSAVLDWNIVFNADIPSRLARDLERTRLLVDHFEANRTADVLQVAIALSRISQTLARNGDPDTAFDYFDEFAALASPAAFLRMQMNPDFDNVRGHPRYQALRERYEEWAEAQAAE